MNVLQQYITNIKKLQLFQPKDKLLIAVSGGVDSVVLCELTKQAGYDFAIAHCNFQLRGEDSGHDEKFVQQLAIKYSVPFYIKHFDTNAIAKQEKKSIEETARNLRYEWFEEIRTGNNFQYILTAHHADDNIETVTMQFFRGTGIRGLRGILPKQNNIVRPLLFAKRADLEIFLLENDLTHIIDQTNAENVYTRNHFRNDILPLIEKNYPGAKENIFKNITRFSGVAELYEQAIDQHKKKLLEYNGNEIQIPVLKLLKTSPLETVVYEIIKDYGFTARQTTDVVALLQSETGKYVQSPTYRIIKNRNWIIISPNQSGEAQHILIEEKDNRVGFADKRIELQKFPNTNYTIQNSNTIAQVSVDAIKFPLLLRKWKQGDYFYPLGMQKKKKLSRFFTDQKLSLTDKQQVWVIEMDKKIVWIVGLRIDDRFKITPATKQILTLTVSS
ncbi:MAG TPA: tRNA lysidine(34) synthetase TilS [Ferruginibacter sp.]|jgi:tRNA(Ile)-lysidine synthase|nr:tRNA lysidine(34) synthetase TilS [Ferruginibacter sp.]